MQKFVATDKVLLLFSVTCRRKVGCFYLNLRDGVMEAGGGGEQTHYDLSAVPDGADLTKLGSPTSLQKGCKK